MSRLISTNPATGATICSYTPISTGELERKIALAASAQLHSVHQLATALPARVKLLQRVAELLTANRDSLARLMTVEMGKLLTESLAEIDKSIALCHAFAGVAENWLQPEEVSGATIRYQPVGVVFAVMPWNFPLWQVMRCAVPAWVAGNSVLLKHATNVTGFALALETLLEEASDGAPLLQTLVLEPERVAGVLEDRRIRSLHFTGSVSIGRKLAAMAAAVGKSSVLELGGADPFLVLDGANVETAAAAAAEARFRNAGQSCTAAKRVVVSDALYDEFVECFTASVRALRCGDPLSANTTLAPLATEAVQQRLELQVNRALTQGAVQLCTGEFADGETTSSGFFSLPRVLINAEATDVAREEMFGPVVLIQRVGSVSEAIAVANDSRYGLGATVWGQSDIALSVAAELQCGSVAVNQIMRSDPLLPFGGVKDSGYGCELGRQGLLEFVTTQTLSVRN